MTSLHSHLHGKISLKIQPQCNLITDIWYAFIDRSYDFLYMVHVFGAQEVEYIGGVYKPFMLKNMLCFSKICSSVYFHKYQNKYWGTKAIEVKNVL